MNLPLTLTLTNYFLSQIHFIPAVDPSDTSLCYCNYPFLTVQTFLVLFLCVYVGWVLQVETRGCVLLTLDMYRLLGLEECGAATETERNLIRILTPIIKLYTAKQVNYPTIEYQFTNHLPLHVR